MARILRCHGLMFPTSRPQPRDRYLLVSLLVAGLVGGGGGSASARLWLPGEFERQAALVLPAALLRSLEPELLATILQRVAGHVPVMALAPTPGACDALARFHRRRRLGRPWCVVAPHETIWLRDYGPLMAIGSRGPRLLDPIYRLDRPLDDAVPAELSAALGLALRDLPLDIDGGNLLSNGAGLFLTTEAGIEGRGGRVAVEAKLAQQAGLERLVVLESLIGEPTRHVDMFATFVAADTVVIGSYDPADDPANAAVLERNARRLRRVRTRGGGHLQVIRIPMPSNDRRAVWRTYTNVIFANGVLLMPSYRSEPAWRRDLALVVFRRLLPGWQVLPLDVSGLIAWGGALHCISGSWPAGLPILPPSPAR